MPRWVALQLDASNFSFLALSLLADPRQSVPMTNLHYLPSSVAQAVSLLIKTLYTMKLHRYWYYSSSQVAEILEEQ